ncbi:hypothetical protein GCM10027429_26500 [Marivirga atlantica]|uniref:Uncharacterized protein n=1 Tax=Marivirga atlantica TaxID=1548457 RepID=A0A937DKH8_9BACT|nr:hypothetical protein [Marivirga atlantica]MBL0766251.1 hypothetical protein [Marivirga atlantica]
MSFSQKNEIQLEDGIRGFQQGILNTSLFYEQRLTSTLLLRYDYGYSYQFVNLFKENELIFLLNSEIGLSLRKYLLGLSKSNQKNNGVYIATHLFNEINTLELKYTRQYKTESYINLLFEAGLKQQLNDILFFEVFGGVGAAKSIYGTSLFTDYALTYNLQIRLGIQFSK